MKLLVFDMGHVFIDFEWHSVQEEFCRRAGCSVQSLRPVFEALSKLGYESGRIGTQTFLDELNARLSTDITRQEFEQLFCHTFRENEQMAHLLRTLKQQLPLYLLSNTNEVHWQWLQAKYDVSRHFQELILSFEVGSVKPEPAIYQEVLRRSRLQAADCLFVDDLAANVAAARELGMHTVQFQGVEPLKLELQKFGLSV